MMINVDRELGSCKSADGIVDNECALRFGCTHGGWPPMQHAHRLQGHLIRKRNPLGPYRRLMPRALGGS